MYRLPEKVLGASTVRVASYSVATMSPRAAAWLRQVSVARVLGVFEHACNLIDERGDVLALVAPEVGNGPFHAVLKDTIPLAGAMQAQTTIRVRSGQIVADHVRIAFHAARLWSPVPAWSQLHGRLEQILNRALSVSGWLHSTFEIGSPLLAGAGRSRWGTLFDTRAAPWRTTEATGGLVTAVARGDLQACSSLAAELAGLGPGSTPSGDDFILGAIYAGRLIHPSHTAKLLSSTMAAAAVPRTTSLSAMWLQAASRGEVGATWHQLFAALVGADIKAARAAAIRILQTGATSGEEALAGFFGVFDAYAALQPAACSSLMH